MTYIKFKRKQKGKTDYKKRLGLLKSNKLRLVVRKSLKNIVMQIIKYNKDGDTILTSAHARELIKLGWKHSRSNIPAAYLTGLLLGKKAKEKNISETILDLGLSPSIKGSTQYAAIKGATETGLAVKVDPKMFPSDDRLRGKHITSYRKKEDIAKDFETIKDKILKK